MTILYVNLEYDYGIKERGPNYIGQDGFLKNLINMGHKVKPFYYDPYLMDTDNLQLDLINTAKEEYPDLIWFDLYGHQFKIETFDILKSTYTTVCWFGDDTWRFEDFTKIYAPHFTYCVTTDKFAVLKYNQIGYTNVILSQWAAIDTHPIPEFDGKYSYGVSFVGGKNSYRNWFINQLGKKGIQVETFGQGWKNGKVTHQEMNQIFVKSKINLNISNSVSYDSRYLLSSPQALLDSFRSNKHLGQIKARNFEIPFFGGFQLTDYFPGIEDYFKIGEEIACFKEVEEAILLINYYLEKEDIREKIKKESHQLAVQSHGYKNRLEEIFKEISVGVKEKK